MATLNPRRFSDAATLKHLSPQDLHRFLSDHRVYLQDHGLELPDEIDPDEFDYAALAKILISPTDETPGALCEGLYFVNEMATHEAMDLLIDNEAVRSLLPADRLAAFGNPDDSALPLTPADVALRIWLEEPALLEQLHVEHDLPKVRSFAYFHCTREKVPAYKAPSQTQLDQLTKALNEWYANNRRGRGAKIIMTERGSVIWFLVRHGEAWRREGCMKGEESSGVVFRPEVYDVLVYNTKLGEIGIHCQSRSQKWLRMYRDKLGIYVFNDPDYFAGEGKYTLEPLRIDGSASLNVEDIEGLEHVTLKELHLAWPGAHNEIEIRKADDIFAALESRNRPIPVKPRIVKAKFTVKFEKVRKPRIVTILPSNVAQYQQDDDSELIERWLDERGFLIRPTPEIEEEDDDIADAEEPALATADV